MKKWILVSVLLLLLIGQTLFGSPADEGMYPISELMRLDLRSKGLEIEPEEIYASDRPSLIYAIVSVGATGSFVSPEGLFVTNHHVAFGAVQAASTKEQDYLTNGFLAGTKAEEIQAKGMTARIIDSFQDVSKEVLGAVRPDMSLADRTKSIERKIKEIVARAEKKNQGKRAEVSEMFTGRTYVLFIYTYLKDIRLVYVPPRSIGEFGGEFDNWTWPRHTGDFSFLRAYTAPDGSSADYSPRNVPFKPKRFLKIDPRGIAEGDFVFLLGYPGRTYRHSTASFMAYEEESRMPSVADWYAWQIDLMEKASAADGGIAMKLASRIKGLANTMKNYRGKLKGMKKLGIVERKRAEERALQAFIEADPKLAPKYADVLASIDRVYVEITAKAGRETILENLRSSVNLFYLAWLAYEASIELRKPDLEREPPYMDRNWAQTKQRISRTLRNHHEPVDRAVLREILLRSLQLSGPDRIEAIDNLFKTDASEAAVDVFVTKAYERSKLNMEQAWADLLKKTAPEIKAVDDPFVSLAVALFPDYMKLRETQKARRGALDSLFARLGEIKEIYLGKAFIPDANNTLRLTFGRIKGYEPADAVHFKPFTTLSGVLEKTTGDPPFDTPPGIIELSKARDFGQFEHPALKDVPVCMLYNADTTGGNSGSPVLNARGELVGVNFDRTYEATINDYAWSEDYSRSIAVDIRYVLWVAQRFGGAGFLLEEMGIR